MKLIDWIILTIGIALIGLTCGIGYFLLKNQENKEIRFMTQQKHSQLPWKIECGLIISNDEKVVGQCWSKNQEDFKNRGNNEKFIIRAANCHYELLEIAKQKLEILKRGLEGGHTCTAAGCSKCVEFRNLKELIEKAEGAE